jgi:hypothetical protein
MKKILLLLSLSLSFGLFAESSTNEIISEQEKTDLTENNPVEVNAEASFIEEVSDEEGNKTVEVSGVMRHPSDIDLSQYSKIKGIITRSGKPTIILDEDLVVTDDFHIEDTDIDAKGHIIKVAQPSSFKPINSIMRNFILANTVVASAKK